MKVFVTGGCGFIGFWLCEKLGAQGWDVTSVDASPPMDTIAPPPNVRFITGDLTNPQEWRHEMADSDLVIHLAAKHRFFGISEKEFYRTNVEGTKSLLDAMAVAGLRNLIFFSSVSVYGEQTLPTTEDTIPDPNSPYGKTKLRAEALVREWTAAGEGRNALIIRPTVVFGPGNRGNIYRMIKQVDSGLYFPVGQGDNVKSVAYVENLVEATIFLIRKGFQGVELYNYSDSPHMPFKAIEKLILDCLGKPPRRIVLPYGPLMILLRPIERLSERFGVSFPVGSAVEKMNKTTHHIADKIRAVGFRPVVTLEEGFRRTIDWYRSNG
jgi:nucleoside-diphosphate-sugar epimerase